MNQNKDEKFYKNICIKYIKTMSKEMLLEKDNKILHIFIKDEYIELKENGKITIDNYIDYLDGNFETYDYDSYQDLYELTIEDEVLNDINDLGLFDDNDKWDFYISFEELKTIGYGFMVKEQYPLLEQYVIPERKIEDFFNHFSLEQLADFNNSLSLYFEKMDIEDDDVIGLYSKSNSYFNKDIIKLAEHLITYDDFISDYEISNDDLLLDIVIAYFRENKIKNLMDYGNDGDEGLTPISSLYKELMDKLNIKYCNVYTEDIADGKYLTTIIFENDYEIKIDTSAWNGIKVVAENIESIYRNYKSLQSKDNISKNNMENDISYC